MPSKSPAQARLMAAVAHDPKFAKKVGVPTAVGKEFNQADTGTGILSKHKGSKMAIHIKESHKGLLHKDLGVAGDKKIPAAKIESATHSKDPAVKKRAVFAENAKKWHHGGAKQPHPKTNPGFYNNEAHAPEKKLADKPIIQSASLGNEEPKMTPQSPGVTSGLPHQFGKPPAGPSHGFGHPVHLRRGSERLSGHSGAHRIGKK